MIFSFFSYFIPFIAIPALMADIISTLRTEVITAGCAVWDWCVVCTDLDC
jgi:hypothetical protein